MAAFVDTANQDYAVVIGIEKYRDKRFQKLDGARNDAKNFVRWLKRRYANARFERDDHIITRMSWADLSDVTSAFAELLDKAPNGGRRLYIFISGHGFGQTVHDACVYCSDYSDLTDPACCNITHTANCLKFAGRFREVIVFIDCCRHYNTSLQPRAILKGGEQVGRPAAHFYLMSCDLGEASEEWKIAGEYTGVFSFNLVRALNGKEETAVDGQGNVTAHSLVRHVRRRVPATMHPHFDPPDDDVLRNLVFAEGFEANPDVFYIKFTQPDSTFSLFSGQTEKGFPRLEWKSERASADGRRVRVYRQNEEAVIVTVPALDTFNSPASCRHRLVQPFEAEIEI
ncbi:MAG TPA: caspase family protein [Bryobacteraceae bacterium]|jgi:hypothetical protein